MNIRPFRGFRPPAELADRVPSFPYDVLNSAEARELAGDDPNSFLHVIKPEIDLDPEMDPYDDRVYAKGRENLERFIKEGKLVRDERPAYYVYRLVMHGQAQTGIVGAAAVQDYVDDKIKKHEFTRPEKENDRVQLNDTLSAHPGPVFLTYRGLPEINAWVTGITAQEPQVCFTAPDGIEHCLWVVDDASRCAELQKLFVKLGKTYVADGHHRAAAASRIGKMRLEKNPNATEDAPSRFFMAVHFPAEQLRVLDYNRVVKDLNGLTPDEFLTRVKARGFQVQTDYKPKKPENAQTMGMYLDGSWYLLTPDAELVPDDVVRSLDVAVLADQLLSPVLGIGDPRTDKRIDFVGGIRGMEELEHRVDSGESAVAFSLFPTRIEDVMAVADSGEVMPPKSTWFEPKLRSGMVVQSLEGDEL